MAAPAGARGLAADPGRRRSLGLLAALVAGRPLPLHADTAHRTIDWNALKPRGWDADEALRALPPDVDTLQDGDPRARAALEQLRAAWDRAPAVPELAGAALRLPGYVVPLKGSKAGLIDFLLVPYLGACVHSPPPPANQVVRCRSARPLPGIRLMEAVWASGRLALERSASPMGTAAYALRIDAVVRQG